MSKKVIAVLLTDQHLDLDNQETWKSCMQQGDELALKYNVPLFLMGDLLENRKAQPQSLLNIVGDYLKNSQVQKYCIPGNHDKVDYQSERSFLDEFEFHPNFNLITNFGTVFSNGFAIHFIPYFDEATTYLKYLNECYDFVKKANDRTRHILLTHVGINGAKSNDGELIMGSLSADLFSIFETVLVGHYHDRGKITKDIQYIGSLFQHNFSEDTEKGFTLLYDDGSYSFVQSKFKQYITTVIHLDAVTQKRLAEITQEAISKDQYNRFEFHGSYENIKSINQNYYKSLGIDVKIKRENIDRGIKEAQLQNIIQFNKTSIYTEFSKFCKENDLNEEEGKKYIIKKLG